MRADIGRALAGRNVAPLTAVVAATQRVDPPAATSTFAVLPDNDQQTDNKGGRALAYALLGAAVIAVFVIAAVIGKSIFDSNNPATVAVPDVKGMTQAAAETALTDEGLQPKVEEANDDTQPKGNVFDQSPEANTQLKAGAVVTIKVSQGVAEVAVPNVVGLSVDTAVVQLQNAGLVVGERKSVNSDQTRNLVTKSTPKAGKQVAAGSTVDLEVASGQNLVPDVRGKSSAEATSILENAGFNPKTVMRETADAKPDTVVDQSPAAKSSVRLDSTVTIFVAQAPPATVSPTPSDTGSPAPP